jgi:hypothetical protein
MIFATVATAGTYLMGAMANNETYFRDGTNSQSEVEFALGRIIENVRAATAISAPASTSASHTITLTNINGQTVTYQIDSSGNLTETVGSTTSTLVHSASLSAAQASTQTPKAFTITLSSGTEQVISRSVTVFGRNL